jgi:hypothetical protein
MNRHPPPKAKPRPVSSHTAPRDPPVPKGPRGPAVPPAPPRTAASKRAHDAAPTGQALPRFQAANHAAGPTFTGPERRIANRDPPVQLPSFVAPSPPAPGPASRAPRVIERLADPDPLLPQTAIRIPDSALEPQSRPPGQPGERERQLQGENEELRQQVERLNERVAELEGKLASVGDVVASLKSQGLLD